MRSKKPFLIITFLSSAWIVITYLLWMRQGSIELDGNYKDMLHKLQQLEDNIREESHVHDSLMQTLLLAIKNNKIVQLFGTNYSSSSSSTDRIDVNQVAVASVQSSIDNSIKEIQLVDGTPNTNSISSRNNLTALRPDAKRDANFKGPIIPVLVFACNRVSVRKCLDNLIEYRPNIHQFPIIVSQVSYTPFYFIISFFLC